MPTQLIDRLEGVAARVGLALDQPVLERLWCAALLLAQIARGSGISGYERAEEALMRGLAPALAWGEFEESPKEGEVADLGAGNGALGAGIAIMWPELQVTLLDRSERAYTACELLVARLDLPNLQARRFEAGRGGAQSHQYDGVLFRALAPGGEALALAASLTRSCGFIGAYHRIGDSSYGAAAAGAAGLEGLGTCSTIVSGLVLSGLRRLGTGCPQ